MDWHIITGEYPPQSGGVSDYTYLLSKVLAEEGDFVHVWAPTFSSEAPPLQGVRVHPVPTKFGLRWLKALNDGLKVHPGERTVLVQYVPHMYGWKAMNVAFCAWLALLRKERLWVMFHEVAFPFRDRQPFKHKILASVHRVMAWSILRLQIGPSHPLNLTRPC